MANFTAPRRFRCIAGATLVVAVVLFAACGWPQARYGPEQTGFNPTETRISAANVSALKSRWSQPVEGGATPSIANGALYVGSGKLYAFDASTGSALWASIEIGASRSAPAVADGVVYVSGDKLYAFDASTGAQRWSAPAGVGAGSPTVADGVVYVSGDKLYAFNASTGARRWAAPAGGGGGSPAVANSVVYVSGDGLQAFSAMTGAQLWAASLSGVGVGAGAPAVANGVVYISDEKLHAFNATTGATLWSAATGAGGGSPAVANGVVYVSGDKLYAFNATTGARLWSTPSGGGGGSPAVANGVVYVENQMLSFGVDIWAFDATTGKQLWSAWAGGFERLPNAHPVVANGVLYTGRYGLSAYGLPIATPQLSISGAIPDDYIVPESWSGKVVTITNVGSMPTSPISTRFSGPDASQFMIGSDECAGTRLAAGASCSVRIHYTPTQEGRRTARFTATASAGGTVNALLTGIGPPFLVFPFLHAGFSAFPGSTSTVSFTVTNLGAVPLGPFTNSVTPSSGFRIRTDTCAGRIIAVGADCTVVVEFAPAASVSYEGQLVTSAAGYQAAVQLQGSGLTQFAATPTPANGTAEFGTIPAGSTRSRQFTITNVSPNAAGPFTNTIDRPGWFAITSDTCAGRTLAGNSSCTITVTFAPTGEGDEFAILQVDAPSESLKLGLYGTGT